MVDEQKEYYKNLVGELQTRLEELEKLPEPEQYFRREDEVLEEVIFKISLGLIAEEVKNELF